MTKYLKCLFITLMDICVIISLLARGYHSIKIKGIIFFNNNNNNNSNNNTVNNNNNINNNNNNEMNKNLENNLIKSDKNDDFISTRKAFNGGMDIDGRILYICRVNVSNETIPGKYSQPLNKCAVTYKNKELKYKRFQLLVFPNSGRYKWKPVRRPVRHLPPNIVLGGKSITGQFYYICQCRVQSQQINRISEQIGKVQYNQSLRQWIGAVPFSGQEIQCFDYSVLVLD